MLCISPEIVWYREIKLCLSGYKAATAVMYTSIENVLDNV